MKTPQGIGGLKMPARGSAETAQALIHRFFLGSQTFDFFKRESNNQISQGSLLYSQNPVFIFSWYADHNEATGAR
jgi:hypothetical protein